MRIWLYICSYSDPRCICTYKWRHASTKGSQITRNSIVCSIACSGLQQRKHNTSYCPFVRGIHRLRMDSPHKWPVKRRACLYLFSLLWCKYSRWFSFLPKWQFPMAEVRKALYAELTARIDMFGCKHFIFYVISTIDICHRNVHRIPNVGTQPFILQTLHFEYLCWIIDSTAYWHILDNAFQHVVPLLTYYVLWQVLIVYRILFTRC